jgi:transcriptional regulator with XRE-family HTH domain
MAENHPTLTNLPDNPRQPRPRAQSFDKALGAAIRRRRILLGLSQQKMAELIGVTYQQAHKSEKGLNRIAAGRLDDICRALDWSIADALQALDQSPRTTASERRRILAGQWFAKLSDRKADAVLNLLRALAEPECDQ